MLSFHDSEPTLHNVMGEYESAAQRAKAWYSAFPEAIRVTTTASSCQLKKLGMELSIFLRPIDIARVLEGWTVADTVIDDVLYHHGETATGVNGFRKEPRRVCVAPCRVTTTVTQGFRHYRSGAGVAGRGAALTIHMAFAYRAPPRSQLRAAWSSTVSHT